MWEARRRFNAVADDGIEYTIVEEANVREERTQWGVDRVEDALRRLRTTEGHPVNFVVEGVYEVLTPAGPVRVRSEPAPRATPPTAPPCGTAVAHRC